MQRINPRTKTQDTTREQDLTAPPIFGLRYLEEEATEIHDIIGCLSYDEYGASRCDEHLPPP